MSTSLKSGWPRTPKTPRGLPPLTLRAFSAPKGQVHQIDASEEHSRVIWAITASNSPQMRLMRWWSFVLRAVITAVYLWKAQPKRREGKIHLGIEIESRRETMDD